MMTTNPYKILGVSSTASASEIKSAFRKLVKTHHPDAGGDQSKIIAVNAAWELLKDPNKRQIYDQERKDNSYLIKENQERDYRNACASSAAQAAKNNSSNSDAEIHEWRKKIYVPIDRLLGQIINPLPAQLKALSADPYDDLLMEEFCAYLQKSQKHMKKIIHLYRSMPTPSIARNLSLNLYHCLSQVEDALNELERYTMGYVDNYLHDGREMFRKAKLKRRYLNVVVLLLKN